MGEHPDGRVAHEPRRVHLDHVVLLDVARTSVSRARFWYTSRGQARVKLTMSETTPTTAAVTIHPSRGDRGGAGRRLPISDDITTR
jgi:hypothetical protein